SRTLGVDETDQLGIAPWSHEARRHFRGPDPFFGWPEEEPESANHDFSASPIDQRLSAGILFALRYRDQAAIGHILPLESPYTHLRWLIRTHSAGDVHAAEFIEIPDAGVIQWTEMEVDRRFIISLLGGQVLRPRVNDQLAAVNGPFDI